VDQDHQVMKEQNKEALSEQVSPERAQSHWSSIFGRAFSWVRGVTAGLNLHGKYRVGIVFGDHRTKFVIVELTS